MLILKGLVLFLIHFRSSATTLELVCCLLPEASAATSARQLFVATQNVYHSLPLPLPLPPGATAPSGQKPTPCRGFTTTLGWNPQGE
jgi:hypothetical protein